LSISSQKYGLGIRDPEKTYSGSRIKKLRIQGLGSGSATLGKPDKKLRIGGCPGYTFEMDFAKFKNSVFSFQKNEI
jgi:hypothetical protein